MTAKHVNLMESPGEDSTPGDINNASDIISTGHAGKIQPQPCMLLTDPIDL